MYAKQTAQMTVMLIYTQNRLSNVQLYRGRATNLASTPITPP